MFQGWRGLIAHVAGTELTLVRRRDVDVGQSCLRTDEDEHQRNGDGPQYSGRRLAGLTHPRGLNTLRAADATSERLWLRRRLVGETRCGFVGPAGAEAAPVVLEAR
jgi:hypothetical protein